MYEQRYAASSVKQGKWHKNSVWGAYGKYLTVPVTDQKMQLNESYSLLPISSTEEIISYD